MHRKHNYNILHSLTYSIKDIDHVLQIALELSLYKPITLVQSLFHRSSMVCYKCAKISISEGGWMCVSLSAAEPETVTMTGWASVWTMVTRCSSGSFSCSVGFGRASIVSSAYLRSRGVRAGSVSVTVMGGSARGARYDGGPLYSEPHHAAPVVPLLKNKT